VPGVSVSGGLKISSDRFFTAAKLRFKAILEAMPGFDLLIVDDDPDVHVLLQSMLKGTSWNPESANSGEEALARLKERTYDVILTDILMPQMDGLSLLGRITEIHPDASVLVMTAENRPDRIAGSIRGHASGYISKPFSREQLTDALADAQALRMGSDDIEVLSDKPTWIAVRARCKLDVAGRLVRFFRELPSDLDQNERDDAAMAFRELLINAVEHGGKLDPDQKVELHFVRTQTSIVYYVRDPGEGFSFDRLTHAAISHPGNPTEHMKVREDLGIRPGGFGLLILNNFADELIYNAKGNEVILIKRRHWSELNERNCNARKT
jgi:CheY-like chemotaxis protein/anti-sigma regulatory factor (Ser/Thr protein kinase)